MFNKCISELVHMITQEIIVVLSDGGDDDDSWGGCGRKELLLRFNSTKPSWAADSDLIFLNASKIYD